MKIRTEPLLGGAALSFIILLVINVVSTFMAMNSMQQTLNAMIAAMADPTAPFPNTFSSPLFTLVGCLACIAPLAAGIGAGVVYARQYAKLEPITGSLVSGGAASAALGFFLSGVVSGILAGVLMVPIMNQLSSLDPSLAASMGPMAGVSVVYSIISSICGGAVYAVIGAMLGAIGAAIGTPKSAKAAPA